MSFTKQTPTKPGAYWWKQRPDQCAFLVERFKDGTYRMAGTGIIYNVDMLECGEWEGPLVTADEAQADAAAMREALEHAHTAINYAVTTGFEDTVKNIVNAALSVNAGRELLAELQWLRDDLAKAQAQCAELRSEVEKAWREGFIDGDFGEASADDCWNQSRARKVATGEL